MFAAAGGKLVAKRLSARSAADAPAPFTCLIVVRARVSDICRRLGVETWVSFVVVALNGPTPEDPEATEHGSVAAH